MHTKKDFYRLLGAKLDFDDYLFWCFRHWYKKECGKESEFYDIVDVVRYPRDGVVTLEFDNDKEKRFDVPLRYLHDPDDDQPEATMLWYSDYWDGPLSGLAVYEDNLVWFHIIDWEHDNLFNMRTFGLYELSDEEAAYELLWHQYFCQSVGYHCNYDTSGKNMERGDDYTQESMDEFYKDHKQRSDKEYHKKNKLILVLDETYFNRGKPKKEVDNEQDT